MKRVLLDITQDRCPLTFVKTRLELEQLNKGDQLLVIIGSKESCDNVTASVKKEGFSVLQETIVNHDTYLLIIEK